MGLMVDEDRPTLCSIGSDEDSARRTKCQNNNTSHMQPDKYYSNVALSSSNPKYEDEYATANEHGYVYRIDVGRNREYLLILTAESSTTIYSDNPTTPKPGPITRTTSGTGNFLALEWDSLQDHQPSITKFRIVRVHVLDEGRPVSSDALFSERAAEMRCLASTCSFGEQINLDDKYFYTVQSISDQGVHSREWMSPRVYSR